MVHVIEVTFDIRIHNIRVSLFITPARDVILALGFSLAIRAILVSFVSICFLPLCVGNVSFSRAIVCCGLPSSGITLIHR